MGAHDFARRTRVEIIDEAESSLATALNTSRRTVKKHLAQAHHHDWVNDPFARGAYSYVRVGGARAPAPLAKAVQGTLHFAGEHVVRRASRLLFCQKSLTHSKDRCSFVLA